MKSTFFNLLTRRHKLRRLRQPTQTDIDLKTIRRHISSRASSVISKRCYKRNANHNSSSNNILIIIIIIIIFQILEKDVFIWKNQIYAAILAPVDVIVMVLWAAAAAVMAVLSALTAEVVVAAALGMILSPRKKNCIRAWITWENLRQCPIYQFRSHHRFILIHILWSIHTSILNSSTITTMG